MVYNIVVVIVVFILGYLFSSFVRKGKDKILDNETTKKVNDVYSILLDNVYSDKTLFLNRINNTVSLETLIDGEGKVTIMYMMDKKDIAIFKNDKCIYTSELLSKDTLDEIITAIDIYHKDKILDTVNMMGLIFSREDFEKKFNLKVEDLKKGIYAPISMEFNNFDSEEEVIYDIDYILDRINVVGIDNLTPDEKKFLNNYNK